MLHFWQRESKDLTSFTFDDIGKFQTPSDFVGCVFRDHLSKKFNAQQTNDTSYLSISSRLRVVLSVLFHFIERLPQQEQGRFNKFNRPAQPELFQQTSQMKPVSCGTRMASQKP